MYKFICLFVLIGTQGFLSAQEYEFPEKIDDNFIFFKSIDNKIHVLNRSIDYVFEKGKWIKNKLKSRSSKRDSLILFHKKGFNNTNFKAINSEDNTYLLLDGGGPVLQLKNDSIIRIDNSLEQKNQFGAASFMYKNKMYMYGGYGMWSFKNYTTYYDFSSNHWELFKTQSQKQPHSRWKPIFNLVGNKLYVLGGRSSQNYMTDIVLKDMFVVDMDLKTIKTLSEEVSPKTPLLFHSHNNGFDLDNKRAFLYNNSVKAFDFPNNKFYNYKQNNLFYQKLEGSPILSFVDTLAFVKKTNGIKKLVLLQTSELKIDLAESLPIFLSPTVKSYFKQTIFVFLCLFLIVIVYKLFSYKDYIENLIQYDKNWLYYSDKKVRITTEQSQAIKLLERNGQFNSIELNKIISKNKKYAKSHLTLLRKNFINDLNKAYNELLNSGLTLISSSKLPKDKRQLLYKTSKETYKKVSFLKFMFKI